MTTKHSIVRNYLKSNILDGTYQPNEKIDSESELMEKFDVSRHTVRLAISDLVTKGWLYRRQGAGTFCSDMLSKGYSHENKEYKNIAIVTTYISEYIFPSIIRGAESYLSEHNYNVTLFSTDNDHNTEKRILETILSQNFSGVIIEPTKSAISNPNINYYLNMERNNIPYIMINGYYKNLDPISITLDDEEGGFLQVEHLVKLGHRNIVGLFKTDDLQGINRMKGFIRAHRKNSLPLGPNNIITYYTEEKFQKPIRTLEKNLKQSHDKIDSIVCYNDELAIHVLDVIRERGLNVAEDISIVGYDNSFLSEVSEVKLTTIDHPKIKMGRDAAKMILKIIDKSPQDRNSVESIKYKPKIIVRNSTKKLNGNKS